MFTIRNMAEKFGLTLRALRFYESKGLIAPARDGVARLYSEEDVKRIEQIALWRKAGIPIEAIRELLRLLDQGRLDDLRLAVQQQLTEIEKELAATQNAIAALRKKAA